MEPWRPLSVHRGGTGTDLADIVSALTRPYHKKAQWLSTEYWKTDPERRLNLAVRDSPEGLGLEFGLRGHTNNEADFTSQIELMSAYAHWC